MPEGVLDGRVEEHPNRTMRAVLLRGTGRCIAGPRAERSALEPLGQRNALGWNPGDHGGNIAGQRGGDVRAANDDAHAREGKGKKSPGRAGRTAGVVIRLLVPRPVLYALELERRAGLRDAGLDSSGGRATRARRTPSANGAAVHESTDRSHPD